MARVPLFLLLVLYIVVPCISTEENVAEELLSSLGRLPPEEFHGRHRVRRQASASIMTEAEKTLTLNKHNELRSQTTPAAANMNFMVWDDTLATHAQRYSDMCVWAHGFPEENITPFPRVGQNLWVAGPTTEAVRPDWAVVTQSWYNEVGLYTFETAECQTGQMCGHYTQVVWASSYALGCGMTFCPTTDQLDIPNAWIFNCHYGPAGNYAGAKPFISGTPCTKCSSGIGQCYNNQCRLCSTHSEGCVCGQTCENCGTLDMAMCKCTCPNGYYGSDCSKDCVDTDDKCGNGWPYSWCNNDYPYVLEACPGNCDLCIPFKDPNFVCVPPTTGPTTAVPPTTAPPATAPPATVSPTTAPPATAPPATVSPTTVIPPTTVPPTVTGPPTSATTAAPTTTLSPSCPSLVCENGGTLHFSACKCICKAAYQGKICQNLREEARYGVRLVLIANINYWKYIESGLLDAVADALTSYCNEDGFQRCCPGKGTKKTSGKLAFISLAHLLIATGYPEIYPEINSQPALVTMLLANHPSTSALCNGGTLSRKRRDTELSHVIHRREARDAFLDQSVLLKAIEDAQPEIRQALSELNVTVTLNSVEAGVEEQLPPTDNGVTIAVIVVVCIIVLAATILILFFVRKYILNQQKVRPPVN